MIKKIKDNKIFFLAPDVNKEVGGKGASTIELCNLLSKNFQIELICFKNDISNKENDFLITSFRVHPNNIFLFSMNYFNYVKKKVTKKDIVHIQSIWLFPNIIPYFIKKLTKCRIVFSPRGTMDKYALKISKIKKIFVYYFLFQKKSLKSADYFHATSMKEMKEIRKLGFIQPIAVIPNPIKKTIIYNVKKEKIITFIGRIHPIKGLDNLLLAWKNIEKDTNYELKIYGIWEDKKYIQKLHDFIKDNNLLKVEINGPIYGDKKNKLYQKSSATIFPSYTENFGNSIGESLMNETLAIVSDKTPWVSLEKLECGFICEPKVNSIQKALIRFNNLDSDQVLKMGKNGRKLGLEKFSSEKVKILYKKFYDWINNPLISAPNFIHFK